jgi:predicted nucleic acid-binding protein
LIEALDLADRKMLQYFDALIITVAARAGATMLLSEDMQDGLEVDGLLVVNPFVAGNDGVIAGGAMRLLKPLLPLLAY